MSALQPELRSGEVLLWHGAPRGGIHFRRTDWLAIPFGLVWCVCAFFGEYSAIKSGAPIFSILFGLPVVIVGLEILVGRFIRDALERRKTTYWVTNKRAIIALTAAGDRKITSIPFAELRKVDVIERADLSGSIYFERTVKEPGLAAMPRWFMTAAYSSTEFEPVDNVRAIYEVILQAKQSEQGPAYK
ncbi:hypothetical protein ACFONN_17255 [Dyella humi]|uniref:PH domain-containing protein n=1 Tax=Dyella humi TaxID=1770547 RepID=A0ABW8IE30_9GAMM